MRRVMQMNVDVSFYQYMYCERYLSLFLSAYLSVCQKGTPPTLTPKSELPRLHRGTGTVGMNEGKEENGSRRTIQVHLTPALRAAYATLQHTATRCNMLQHAAVGVVIGRRFMFCQISLAFQQKKYCVVQL